jgi:hypothetical protein
MRPNYNAINAARSRAIVNAEVQRTSEVARIATELQRQTGCTRTEALRIADARIPHR